MIIGAAVIVVLGILLFVFMTPDRTETTDTMQNTTGTQMQDDAAPAEPTETELDTTTETTPADEPADTTVPTTQP